MPIYESDLKRILKPWVKELIMAGGSSAGPFLSGSGTTGRIVEFGAPTVIQDSSLIKSGAGLLTLASAGAYTLTVPATGTAVIGSGAANRLAVFSDEHTLAQSYALTTVGDLMYMANQGSLETQTYYETSIYVNPSFTGTFTLSTLTFSRTIIAGDTISFDIDLYSQCDGFPTSSVLIAVRRGSSTGAIVASQTVTRDITRPPNPEDHWVATVVDSSPVQTYYITVTEQSAGFGMWFSSSARFIEGQLLSTDPIPARLPIGSEDQFLRVASGVPAWETVSVITGVSDTASVDLTVTGSTLSAAVLAGGVDHNSLANLTVGDVHTQYALRARTITEGAGLAGNTYDLSANRTLAMGTPSTVTVSTTNSVSGTTHAHAATSSSNPGAAARLLASTANGYLTLVRLGFGRSPQSQIDAISDSGVTFNGVTHSNTAATDTNYIFTRGRGTIATPAAVQQGDSLGSLQFKAYYDGTTISGSRGKIIVNAAENWSSTNQGVNVGFQITPTGGSTTLTTLFGLYGAGLVAVGSSIPTARFHVFGVADVVQTIIQAHSTQINNVLEIQSSAAGVLGFISGTGTAKFSGYKAAVTTKTANYTATVNDQVIVANKATAITITLPAATGTGQHYHISSIGAGACTIQCNAAETIWGSNTQTLYQYESLDIWDYAAGVWTA